MAQAKKKKPKRSPWLKRFLLFVFVPLFVWFLAFLIWFNWNSVAKLFNKANLDDRPPAKTNSRKSERLNKTETSEPSEKTSRPQGPDKPENVEPPRPPAEQKPAQTKERILDEDRKRLEELLKNK